VLAAAPAATALFFLPDDADDSETPSPYFYDRPLAADKAKADRGVSSIQFVLAAALALLLFLALANLVVVQYGKGAVRSALEQGARAGTTAGPSRCEDIATGVVQDLLGGRMSDDLELSCVESGGAMVASASVSFESWTPLTPDFELSLTARAVVEP
jgi:Flp pilus assembly protein TadG